MLLLLSSPSVSAGNAIYVYVILAPDSAHSDLDADSDLLFTLDGESVGEFSLDGTTYDDYQYDVLVYSNSSIGLGQHTFILQNGQDGGSPALVLFDYMVYS